MRKFTTVLLGLLVFCFAGAPIALADSTSLQSALFVLNGTQYLNTLVVPGINAAGFDGTTGTGTLTFTITGAGPLSFNAFFDHQLNLPFFNEYGAVNGAPVAGQTWQIDDPTFGTIFANTQGNTLDDINWVPGTTDNNSGLCANVYAAGCANTNDDVSMAMGFSFNLLANQQELITLNLSHTAPVGGFFLHQIHPIDGCDLTGANCTNPVQLDLYFSGSALTQPTGVPSVPEPSTLILLLGATPCALIFKALRHKLSTA